MGPRTKLYQAKCRQYAAQRFFQDCPVVNPSAHTNVKERLLEIRTGVTYTKVVPKKKLPPEIRDYFVRMGKMGGALGGHARAANMTQEQRSESARNAVTARWKRRKDDDSKAFPPLT